MEPNLQRLRVTTRISGSEGYQDMKHAVISTPSLRFCLLRCQPRRHHSWGIHMPHQTASNITCRRFIRRLNFFGLSLMPNFGTLVGHTDRQHVPTERRLDPPAVYIWTSPLPTSPLSFFPLHPHLHPSSAEDTLFSFHLPRAIYISISTPHPSLPHPLPPTRRHLLSLEQISSLIPYPADQLLLDCGSGS